MEKTLTEQLEAAVDKKEATFLGEGPWIEGAAHQAYKWNDKFYVWIVYDQSSCWVLEDSAFEVQENELENYLK